MILLAYSVAGLLVISLIAEMIALLTTVKTRSDRVEREGLVSILLVVRNEEDGIKSCITSLLSQHHENLELLVADDASTDSTVPIIKSLIEGKENVTLLESPVLLKRGINPKANNLAALQAIATGEYIAVADGDCVYPPDWIGSLLRYKPEVGIVSGVTGIAGSKMQNIDWITSVGRISLLNSLGFRTSAVGNNMLFDREAYNATGGWEGVAHHLTEDFELNRQMVSSGFSSVIAFDQAVFVKSSPASIRELFTQRKRWMKGVQDISLPLRLLILIDALLVLFAIILFLVIPIVGLILVGSYLVVRTVGDMRLIRKIDRNLVLWVIPYEIWRVGMNISFFTYNIVSNKVIWKDRAYR